MPRLNGGKIYFDLTACGDLNTLTVDEPRSEYIEYDKSMLDFFNNGGSSKKLVTIKFLYAGSEHIVDLDEYSYYPLDMIHYKFDYDGNSYLVEFALDGINALYISIRIGE